MSSLVYLGLVNAVRNIGRSLLTVVAMTLAALMMTSSLTAGEGHTATQAAEYRAFLGGDILVYPTWSWPTESDVANMETGAASLAVMSDYFESPLKYFHPDYYTGGYLTVDPSGAPEYSMFRTRTAMDKAIEALEQNPQVTGVVPYTAVPVMEGSLDLVTDAASGPEVETASLDGFSIRACPPNLFDDAPADTPAELQMIATQLNPPPYVVVVSSAGDTLDSKKTWDTGVVKSSGRQLTSADSGKLVAVINRRAVVARDGIDSQSVAYDLSGGQTVRVTLPRIRQSAEPGGEPYYDFADPVTVDIQVVGTYDLYSRILNWVPAPGTTIYEQLYWEAPELLMPEESVNELLSIMGLPDGGLPPVGALSLRLADQSKTEEIVPQLRQAVPDLSVVSVANETLYANVRALPEKSYECPPDQMAETPPLRQPAVPAAAGNVFGIILFGFAGLVAAGNATLLVLNRRTEFAILKAIGMRGFEVAVVVMVEVLTLSVVGLVVGFIAGEATAVPVILSNSVGIGALVKAVASDFGVVAAATLGCAVVFSLVPMSKTLRITVAEAMRENE